ncbi:uncharacterized protein SPSK_07526 [Sporothrix schenckii 1099-18]|uniref:Borealin N-terminal domain-containing protein n=2 Tax=Sporothrix schenckii TaxID=29908 RepID=U7Q254_SPOS1|nr:uncharacterized protein SPSK_07526 [Sporothrix schenckii 1099-18]ERT01277.1 hypothetical protein HMPREF1624_02519 [Sporothrix schenckii ATCC 58251]KJR88444.1 hypothetical protein SPSK_07526 [Sporothrix schenckii 1099-18]
MPPRGRKRKSDQSVASEVDDAANMIATTTATTTTTTTMATKTEETSSKRQKVGVTIAQKQALIDNLQLEVTERARKLRAQYNLQAQGLRTRIEIRVNRIPMALRKLKMADLLLKHSTDQQKPIAPKQTTAASRAPPPVPEKDFNPARSVVSRAESPRAAQAAVNRPLKRLSDQLASGDKENQNTHLDSPKKRQRGAPGTSHGTQPGQVLSPASSNSRMNPRDRERGAPAPPSPAKSFIARPMSPTKQASATNLISSMVEKARATRAATTRKPTTSSTASSAAGGATATAARTRGRGAASKTTAAPASRSAAAAAARNARRISGISESSDASTSTVVRKVGRPAAGTTAATARKVTGATAATTKKTVMSSIKKGVASATTKRAPASKATAATSTTSATTRSGRVLRKRD